MGFAENQWILGVVLAAFASAVSNVGVNLQKLTHIRLAKLTSSEIELEKLNTDTPSPTPVRPVDVAAKNNGAKYSYVKSNLWRTGIALVVLGSFADFAALAFAEQSIIAPLGSLTLVSNVLLAPALLKEHLSRRDVLSTLVIVAGCCLSVAFASKSDEQRSPEQLFSLFVHGQFLFYCIVVGSTMMVMWLALQNCERLLSAFGAASPQYIRVQKYHRFLYASLSGTMGAQNVLFAKCTAELLSNTFQGNGVLFAFWQAYIVLGALGITIFLQIRWLNEGLKRFDALYVVPIFQAFWILVSVIGGLVFFQEIGYFYDHETARYMFPFAIIVTIGGVIHLSKRAVSEAGGQGAEQHTPHLMSRSRRSSSGGDSAGFSTRRLSSEPFDSRVGLMGHGAPVTFGAASFGRVSTVLDPSFHDEGYDTIDIHVDDATSSVPRWNEDNDSSDKIDTEGDGDVTLDSHDLDLEQQFRTLRTDVRGAG